MGISNHIFCIFRSEKSFPTRRKFRQGKIGGRVQVPPDPVSHDCNEETNGRTDKIIPRLHDRANIELARPANI